MAESGRPEHESPDRPDKDAELARAIEAYDDPFALADDEQVAHQRRLALLRGWRARAEGDTARQVKEAIELLEAKAEARIDEPEDAPRTHGYGVVDRD